MTHVVVPFLVIQVLHSVSTTPIIDGCLVCISMKDVDVSEPSAHFDRVVTRATISAMPLAALSVWASVGTYTLGPILQASIVKTSIGAEVDTPENGRTFIENLRL